MKKKKKLFLSLSPSFSLSLPHAPFSRYLAAFISSTPFSTSAIEAENFRVARAPSSEGKGSHAKKRGGGRSREEERTKARATDQERATSSAAAEEEKASTELALCIRWRPLEENAATAEEPAREAAAKASSTEARSREGGEGPKSESVNDSPLARRTTKKKLDAARTRAKERDCKRACLWAESSRAAILSSCCSSVKKRGEEEGVGEEASFFRRSIGDPMAPKKKL